MREIEIKLYEIALEERDLTLRVFQAHGLSKKEIKELEENDCIEKKQDIYTLCNVTSFFLYGKSLITKLKFAKAKRCILKCLDLGFPLKDCIYELLYLQLITKDYASVILLIDELKNINSSDYYFYLYALGYITELPVEKRKIIATIRMKDIKIKPFQVKSDLEHEMNQIRATFFKQKFPRALQMLTEYELKSPQKRENSTTRLFINETINARMKFKNELFGFIFAGNYPKSITILQNPLNGVCLSYFFSHLLKVIISIEEIKKTGVVPPVDKHVKIDGIYSAIDANDYETALDYATIHIEKYGDFVTESVIIEKVLRDFCLLKSKLLESNKAISENPTNSQKVSFPYSSNIDIYMGNVPLVINSYNVQNLENVVNEILEQKKSIPIICKSFGLSIDQTKLVTLILAKEFFYQGLEEAGTVLLESVENAHNNSNYILKVIEEVKQIAEERKNTMPTEESPYTLSLRLLNPYLLVS